MNLTIKIGIMIYIIIIIQLSILSTALYLKSKKNEKLFSLLFVNLCGIMWMFFAIMEKFSSGTEHYLFFIRFPLVAIHLLSLAGLIFTLFFLDILNKTNKNKVWLLFLPNLILFLPYFTNNYFYLIVEKCINNSTVVQWGIVLWASKILSYLYLIIAIVLLLYSTIMKKKALLPNMLMIIAFISPLLIHFLMEFKIFDPHGFDFTPVSFSIVFALYSILSFKYNAVDLRPKASFELFDNISLPVIILDKSGVIEDYNEAFDQTFIKNTSFIIDKEKTNVKDFLDYIETKCINYDEFIFLKDDIISQDVLVKGELSLRYDDEKIKHFLLESLILKTKKNFSIGKMIMIYDTTEYKELILLEERFKNTKKI